MLLVFSVVCVYSDFVIFFLKAIFIADGLVNHHISNSSGWLAPVLRKWKGTYWEFSLTAAVSDCPHSSNAVLNLLSLLRWDVLKREWRLILTSAWNYFKQSKSCWHPNWVPTGWQQGVCGASKDWVDISELVLCRISLGPTLCVCMYWRHLWCLKGLFVCPATWTNKLYRFRFCLWNNPWLE